MSEIKVNKISQRSGTAITLGNSGTDFQLPSGADIVAQSGSVITIAAGATITNNGTATGFGATGAVNWDTTPKTTTVTAVSGVGYFVNTTSGAITVNLPAGVAGAIVAISDYANTAATNKITIDPNGTDKINGLNQNAEITTNGAAVTLIFIDATRGWKDVNDATLNVTGINPFVLATGGTILTCGDFKTHVFTGPGTFTVTCAGTPAGSNSVEYLTVAGGGGGGSGDNAGGGRRSGGGGGAGGYRQNYPSPTTAGLPVTAQAYPITVGSGGAGSPTPSPSNRASSGNNSIFSTITSAGGGYGQNGYCQLSPTPAGSGGSGGGSSSGGAYGAISGAGNTPPVSPSQGNPGNPDTTTGPGSGAGGGGGAGSASPTRSGPACFVNAGPGGAGSPIATIIFGPTSPSYGTTGPAPGRYFAGGGGGGGGSCGPNAGGTGGAGGGGSGATFPSPAAAPNGTVNTGGGGGGGVGQPSVSGSGGSGGSGIVVIRYKFQ
jgi:hypothetical protein